MPRPKNKVATVKIRVAATHGTARYLEQLVKTGLFGKTPPEAAERLITRGIESLLKERFLKLERNPLK